MYEASIFADSYDVTRRLEKKDRPNIFTCIVLRSYFARLRRNLSLTA